MLGSIIGDIVGSRFEWNNVKTKGFDFLAYRYRDRRQHHVACDCQGYSCQRW
ncbi:hypothetical protein SPSYN_01956 [Sporotomaculum syntrophicum]|uniref:ADP-ribosylglycohydrolase n=1 Tax=Sporotomaculum syntrophicum TaxID=182264 RepID=A0A9D2WPY8_9FIRM|nr:hypothetical protein SPSYN_01956 [Sporotomaculum syntrophicum]